MKLKLRRFKVRKFRIIELDGGWTEVSGFVRVKPTPKTSPPLPDGSRIIVSEDGCFVYQDGEKFWTCPLSPDERKLIREVGRNGGELDGDEAYRILWPKGEVDDGKRLRDIVTHINAKIKKREMPVHVSFSDWCVRISAKSTI